MHVGFLMCWIRFFFL
uniref:Uncharacterized protein n=1 Tax=Rhizophora mucronata TaxID=61149 RepID=A0A2P2N975_RHIMU